MNHFYYSNGLSAACFVEVPASYHPEVEVIETGFSISGWVKATEDTDGFLLAKTSSGGERQYYAVRLTSLTTETFSSATVEFRYSVSDNPVSCSSE